MSEKDLRQAVKDAGVKLLQNKLVQGTWGNIAIRLDDKNMIVTPSGMDYIRMGLDDLVIVNMETLEYDSKIKPTSEKRIHAQILLERPSVNAVIHSHPRNSSSFAAARVELPVISSEMEDILGGNIRVSSYGLPGTKKLAKATVEALQGRNACFMANHGAIVCAESMDKAFKMMSVLEECAGKFIEMQTNKISNKEVFDRKDLFDIFKKKYAK